ncbi:hypothetical protein Tco_0540222 [Tanacetum coccineum]
MPCIPDDIIESVISCETAKAIWTDLVHSFVGSSDTKKNRIMDLKLQYQTFRAKPSESISQTYTRYKTLLDELANDGVNLSKHEINVAFVNSLLEKWLTFSQGLRNANHTQILDLVDIYGRFADPKIQKDYKAEYKKLKAKLALLEAIPSTSQTPKNFQPKNKADDELTVEKIYGSFNGDWFEQFTIRKLNILISMDEDVDWQNYLKYINIDIKFVEDEQIPHQKKKVLGGELLTESSSKMNENENPFVPASIGFSTCSDIKKDDHRTSDHEMYNASLKRSKNYKARPYQYASPSKQILKAKAKPFPPCTHYGFNDHIPDDYRYYHECDICRSYDHFTSRHNHVIHIKGGVVAESSQSSESSISVKCNTCGSIVHSTTDHNEFDHFKKENSNDEVDERSSEEYLKDLDIEFHERAILENSKRHFAKDCLSKMSEPSYKSLISGFSSKDYKAEYKKLKAKLALLEAIPSTSQTPKNFQPKNKADDELTVGKNHARNGEWIDITMRKRHIRETIWYLDSRCSRSMTSVKSYLHKYVEQPGPKVVFGDNSSCIIEGYGSINCGGKCLHLLHMDLFGPVSLMSINHEKYTLFIVDEYSRERIPDISYFYMFGCPMFIHNQKDNLGKFDAKADDGYFLGYSFVSKAFIVFTTRRQQVEETYHC